jgi:3-phenylpropionate/cinnamic acid dioxygenase small subunit
MADRDEISALVYHYAELLDQGDLAGVVRMFADATCRSGATGRELRTPEEIATMYDPVRLYEDGTPRTRHLVNNLVIELVDGADEATGRCYYTVLQGVDPGGPIETILAGRYLDRYRRGADGWQFAERVFHADIVGDLSRHYVTPSGA